MITTHIVLNLYSCVLFSLSSSVIPSSESIFSCRLFSVANTFPIALFKIEFGVFDCAGCASLA